MKIFIAGQREFGAATYRMLRGLDGVALAGVSAPPFRGDGVRSDRLRELAEADAVPWMPAGTLRAATLPAGTDLIVCAHAHDFIGAGTRAAATLGAIGYHPSLLPRHRGRDAIRWTVHMREPITGGSVYWLNDRMDGGDLAAQDFVHVAPDETVDSLWRAKLFPLGLALLERTVRDLLAGTAVRQPQDERYATFEPSWDRDPLPRPE